MTNKIRKLIDIINMKFKFKKSKPVTRTCSVTGIVAPETEFYSKQTHLKAVDNIRRNNDVTKKQLQHMFKQINTLN